MQAFITSMRDIAGSDGTVDRQAFEIAMRSLGAKDNDICTMLRGSTCGNGSRVNVEQMLHWLSNGDTGAPNASPMDAPTASPTGNLQESPKSFKPKTRKTMRGSPRKSLANEAFWSPLMDLEPPDVPRGLPLEDSVAVLQELLDAGTLENKYQIALKNGLAMLDRVVARAKESNTNQPLEAIEDAELTDDTRSYLASFMEDDVVNENAQKLTFREAARAIIIAKRFDTRNDPAHRSRSSLFNTFHPQLMQEMQNIDSLESFDIFKVNEMSKQQPLKHVGIKVMHERSFPQTFHLSSLKLCNFLEAVESRYKAENPYHNGLHAADVVQGVHMMMNRQRGLFFSEIEVLGAVLAAVGHDVGHPGVTNQYLMNVRDSVAITYNDVSVNENMHASILYTVLGQDQCELLEGLSDQQFISIRKMVINMILATDMKHHFEHVKHLHQMLEAEGDDLSHWESTTEALNAVVHSCDISNVTRPFEQAVSWAQSVLKEFFQQGDRERELGMAISPLCDRNKVTMEGSQPGFVNFVVKPLFVEMNTFCDAEMQLANMDAYSRYWSEKAKEIEDAKKEAESNSKS